MGKQPLCADQDTVWFLIGGLGWPCTRWGREGSQLQALLGEAEQKPRQPVGVPQAQKETRPTEGYSALSQLQEAG